MHQLLLTWEIRHISVNIHAVFLAPNLTQTAHVVFRTAFLLFPCISWSCLSKCRVSKLPQQVLRQRPFEARAPRHPGVTYIEGCLIYLGADAGAAPAGASVRADRMKSNLRDTGPSLLPFVPRARGPEGCASIQCASTVHCFSNPSAGRASRCKFVVPCRELLYTLQHSCNVKHADETELCLFEL